MLNRSIETNIQFQQAFGGFAFFYSNSKANEKNRHKTEEIKMFESFN